MLLERHNRQIYLHRVVNGDEMWIYYENPKRKKSYVDTNHVFPQK